MILCLILSLLCFLDYLFSLGKLTSEHVSKTAMQLKSVLEDKVASHTDVILVTELMNIKRLTVFISA